MIDTTPPRDAYRALLDAAVTVADSGDTGPVPPAGEWNADQILAHVSLISAATIAAAASVASGANTTYDNRIALDTWTIERLTALAGGNAGLRDRIRRQGDALCVLGGPMLSEAELDTLVPTLLLSNDTVLVDQPVPLRDLITGLADVELPGTRSSSWPYCQTAPRRKPQGDLPVYGHGRSTRGRQVNPALSKHALEALSEHGLQIPDEMALAGFDGV